jgi:hypothetical protein
VDGILMTKPELIFEIDTWLNGDDHVGLKWARIVGIERGRLMYF